jgi:23S rRNA (cytosine1962-C5)-methyltransferase
MFDPAQYQLLDFGDGRKLEQFGELVLDRPSPAAEGVAPARSQLWRRAAARYERGGGDRGEWRGVDELPVDWVVAHGPVRFELKLTEFGHVGLFPEQAENWDWIAEQVYGAAQVRGAARPVKVLNLFAYTGGSTLAAAAAGAEVVHVDAAENTVAWARRNAQHSGLAGAPIRWIAEDAVKFVRRELKRGNRYDAVILDPPSYGHGPRGEVWRLAEDLPALLSDCAELTSRTRQFMLLTCHSPLVEPDLVRQLLESAFGGRRAAAVLARRVALESLSGGRLDCGVMARWPA